MYQFHKNIDYLPKWESFYDVIRNVRSDSEEIQNYAEKTDAFCCFVLKYFGDLGHLHCK
jgi:hypothetical protein